MAGKKIRVAVFFGGKSPEHEVSIITGIQAIENFDKEKYDVFPVYVAKDGKWYSGPELSKIETFRNLLSIPEKSVQETISFDDTQKGLLPLIQKSINPFRKSNTEPIDVIFQAFHGGLGENGGMPGVFEAMDLPYVGPGITGGVLGMDKVIMKQIFEQNYIPISKWLWFYRNEWENNNQSTIERIEKNLKYPLFVKPAAGGSSIGTTKAHNKKELENAIEVAAVFDKKIIVEESFENAREINISVLGNAGSDLQISVCEEVFSSGDLLSYEDKYIGNKGGKSKGMATTKRQIPAKIPKDIEKQIRIMAKKVFEILDSSGVSRIDFLYNEKTKKIVVLEINTIPGSLAFYLWEASGLTFKKLLDRLIVLAQERYNESKKNITTFQSNILENFKGSKGKA